jgi:hypothetical protein
MRAAISATIAGHGSREELQAAARDFVRALRAREQTPEGALLEIKSVLGQAGLRAGELSDDRDPPRPDAALYRDIITWSIKAYYEMRDGR